MVKMNSQPIRSRDSIPDLARENLTLFLSYLDRGFENLGFFSFLGLCCFLLALVFFCFGGFLGFLCFFLCFSCLTLELDFVALGAGHLERWNVSW